MKFTGITIGVPREILAGEQRVAVIPETVQEFIAEGARVLVESGAGLGAYYNDTAYQASGAEIVSDVVELYRRARIILKVKEPQFNEVLGSHEADLMSEDSILVCFLHPANPANHDTVRMLAARRVSCFTLDSIPRVPRAQHMDALTAMSTVAGYKAVISAAHHFSRFVPMIPTASGIIQPARVLVVGTGVAGLQAIATAKRLGAKVSSLDIRAEANEQARSLGAQLIPFELPEGMGVGEGGYATRLPDAYYCREREALTPAVQESDIVILTALVPREKAPVLVDRAMVEKMQKGSVIVDISIDQGGNCELTRAGEEYAWNDILISGLKNIPAHLAVDATRMFAHNVYEYLKHIASDGRIDLDAPDEIVQESLVVRDGQVVHKGTLKAMEDVVA